MDHFVDIFSGVAKIVVAVVGSAIASTQIPKPRETLKDFGFIITNVLLPCLFLGQMIEAVSYDLLMDSYILFVGAGMAVLIGYLGASLLTRFVFPDTARFSTIEGVSMRLVVDRSAKALARHKKRLLSYPREAGMEDVPPQCLIVRIPAHVSPDEVMQTLVVPTKEQLSSIGYRTCVTIATMLQNTFVLPMSLLQSLVSNQGSSFDWIDLKQVTAYIFFFNIIITVAFWMVGPLIVRSGARLTAERQRISEIVARHTACMRKVSRATQTAPEGADKASEEVFDAVSYSWRDDSGDSIVVLRRGDASVDEDAAEVVGAAHTFDWEKIKGNIAPLINAPLLSMFLGILLGMIPFTKEFLLHSHGRVLFDVCSLIGGGTVPASLFLLGCNLSTDFSVVASKAVTYKHFAHGSLLPAAVDEDSEYEYYEEPDEGDPDSPNVPSSMGFNSNDRFRDNGSIAMTGAELTAVADAQFLGKSFVKGQDPALAAVAASVLGDLEVANAEGAAPQKKRKRKVPASAPATNAMPSPSKLYSLEGINTKFVLVLTLARLVVIPTILFAMTYALIKSGLVASIADPCGNLVLLTMLVELFAPSAINTALLFNMEQFMIREYSKALLYQYSFAVLTLMGWLMLTIQIVQGDECKGHHALTPSPTDSGDRLESAVNGTFQLAKYAASGFSFRYL